MVTLNMMARYLINYYYLMLNYMDPIKKKDFIKHPPKLVLIICLTF